MPRPYGLTSGEGRYKALSGLGMVTTITNPNTGVMVFGDVNTDIFGTVGSDPSNNWTLSDWSNYWNNNYGAGSTGAASPTIGDWIKKNQGMLILGVATGLLFFGRR